MVTKSKEINLTKLFTFSIKILSIIIVLLINTSCTNKIKDKKKERTLLLLAHQEVPFGLLSLHLYEDNYFELNSKTGTYTISNDTIYFKYKGEIDVYHSKGIINNKHRYIYFISDSLELMNNNKNTGLIEIKFNKLTKNH